MKNWRANDESKGRQHTKAAEYGHADEWICNNEWAMGKKLEYDWNVKKRFNIDEIELWYVWVEGPGVRVF